MNEQSEAKLRERLKQRIRAADPELHRDLWPRMLGRLQERSAAVPWFDWALLAALALWLCLTPSTIPVLLYHL